VRDRGQPNGFGHGAVRPDLGDIEGRHRAVISAEDQPGLRRVESQGADSRGRVSGRWSGASEGPRSGSRCRSRRASAPGAHGAVLAAWLDRDGSDGVPELVRRRDVVCAPQDQPTRHRVLGEMRVRPFVDRMRFAVAPVLQEFGGRPCVIDLVEVHLVRLGEAEQAEPEGRQDQDEDEPGIEPVESTAALVHQRPCFDRHGPVGRAADRRSSR
jgi:hypothetical protein